MGLWPCSSRTQYLNVSLCVQKAIDKQFQNFLSEETEEEMTAFCDVLFGLPYFRNKFHADVQGDWCFLNACYVRVSLFGEDHEGSRGG